MCQVTSDDVAWWNMSQDVQVCILWTRCNFVDQDDITQYRTLEFFFITSQTQHLQINKNNAKLDKQIQ